METVVFILLVVLLVVLTAVMAAVPSGTLLHELLRLPLFWLNMLRAEGPARQHERFTYGSHPRQYFLLFPPAGGRPERDRAVVYFHGGGWALGSPEAFRSNAAVFQREGYWVALPSVRRLPGCSFAGIRQDLDLLLPHLQEVLRDRTGRSDDLPLVVGGMSSGGHLAAHLALDQRSGCRPAGLFLLGAPTDLHCLPDSAVRRALAGAPGGPSFRQANPVELLPHPSPFPLLIIHGERDGLVPFAAAASFHDRLRRHAPPDLLHWRPLPGSTHLDVASWGHSDNEVRRVILEWLERLETEKPKNRKTE